MDRLCTILVCLMMTVALSFSIIPLQAQEVTSSNSPTTESSPSPSTTKASYQSVKVGLDIVPNEYIFTPFLPGTEWSIDYDLYQNKVDKWLGSFTGIPENEPSFERERKKQIQLLKKSLCFNVRRKRGGEVIKTNVKTFKLDEEFYYITLGDTRLNTNDLNGFIEINWILDGAECNFDVISVNLAKPKATYILVLPTPKSKDKKKVFKEWRLDTKEKIQVGGQSCITFPWMRKKPRGNEKSGTRYLPSGTKISLNTNTIYTLTPIWEEVIETPIPIPKVYKVEFDTGSESSVPTQYCYAGEKAKKPFPNPTKEGYQFDGWMIRQKDHAILNFNFDMIDEPDKLVPFDFETRIYKDIVLYANWIADGSTNSDTKQSSNKQDNGFDKSKDNPQKPVPNTSDGMPLRADLLTYGMILLGFLVIVIEKERIHKRKN